MFINSYYIVYPDGDTQEIGGRLRLDQLVDINGNPMRTPLPSSRIIAYRVIKIVTKQSRGEDAVYHYLEVVPARELEQFVF